MIISIIIFSEIQLSVLNTKSWSEIFVMSHGDMVCIGYDVKLQKFVTLAKRWNNFIHSYPNTWLTNFNNKESIDTLENASRKYNSRGFKCFTIEIINIAKDSNTASLSGNDMYIISDTRKSIYNKLSITYKRHSDFTISDTVDHLYDKSLSHDYIKKDELNENHPFIKYVLNFDYPNGEECPITMERYCIAAINKNCKHNISLKAFILLDNMNECQICRSPIDPEISNVLEKKWNKVSGKKNFGIRHKFTYRDISTGSLNRNIDNYSNCKLFSFDINKIPNLKLCDCDDCIKLKTIPKWNKSNYKIICNKMKSVDVDSDDNLDDDDIDYEYYSKYYSINIGQQE